MSRGAESYPMTAGISKLTTQDLDAVDALMKRYTKWLGFLPREALRSYFEKGGVYGAKTEEGVLIGYLLYAENPRRFRIAHLCVAEEFGKQGIARRLVDTLKKSATTQKAVVLNCRRDFPAHGMWPKLGFVPIGEKPGRSSAGLPLNQWYLPLAKNDQLSLFQARISDETIDVIIDSQIFFDLEEPDSDISRPSKALVSDFLIDSLNLWVTDEVLIEIDRGKDSTRRGISRQRAEFWKIEYDPKSLGHFEKDLYQLLPANTVSQRSDIRHLAKAAASDADTFVTRDQALLNKAAEITDLTNLRILHPTELIIRLHELSERQSYISSPVSGITLEWRRLTSRDLSDNLFASFHIQDERKGIFRERLNSFLARPDQYECQLLWSGSYAVALRVRAISSGKILSVPFVRAASSGDRSLFERYLIVDTLNKAVDEGFEMVKVDGHSLPSRLKALLLATGFTKCGDSFVRFCLTRCIERREALSEINGLAPESTEEYRNMPDIELERHCSPMSMATDQDCLLIPIRPGYAISLVDTHQSASGLFGGEVSVLLRWENVYYRKKTHHRTLRPPARILWYVSGKKRIVAISQLDEVVVDTPKDLFKRFKKMGVLNWQDLHRMCGYDTERELMVLKFSHTFPFRNPISLAEFRSICQEDGVKPWVQSLRIIPTATFQKLFQIGYSTRP